MTCQYVRYTYDSGGTAYCSLNDGPAAAQIDRLAEFIANEMIPGEPSQSQGAVDAAIRLLRAAYITTPDSTDSSVSP